MEGVGGVVGIADGTTVSCIMSWFNWYPFYQLVSKIFAGIQNANWNPLYQLVSEMVVGI